METARAIVRLLRPHKDRGRTHSREKGCAENAKGRLRQCLPKRMRLEGATARQVETTRLRKSTTVRAGAWTG